MNSRFNSFLILSMLVLAAAVSVWLSSGEQVAGFQSPVSPISPVPKPLITPMNENPQDPARPEVVEPVVEPEPAEKSPTLWSSPWFWVTLGIVLFGGAAIIVSMVFKKREQT